MPWLASLLGAILFYTTLPLPSSWPASLERIARWVPLVGLFLGLILLGSNFGLTQLHYPEFVRAGLLVAALAWLTGGLHLDGAADTADGLAVFDPERRLAVMRDSLTGAFGVMALSIILLLKTVALSALLTTDRLWGLPLALGWARWGQLVAIAGFPYLRPEGKGAIHRQTLKMPQDLLLGPGALLAYSAVWYGGQPQAWPWILLSNSMGSLIAGAVALGLGRKLGGHTGDSYGAVVEWAEVLILCALTMGLG
ncbi:adenosylcobinamide-GDP ribazoletransferase [Synechocystis sp. LKSZ1]|uniref:adenosylcobinamide-GDP ribazoletransferase n=1 Tax=Synechocystis sp. LKSZ1 TaxID=3144951 RepID=UPI00336BFF33